MPDPATQHDDAAKIQALALVYWGISTTEASQVTGISTSQINRLRKKAESRGYDPKCDNKRLKLEHVADAVGGGKGAAAGAPRGRKGATAKKGNSNVKAEEMTIQATSAMDES